MRNVITNIFSKINVLDVTLRDGGYRNQFHFDQGVPERLINDLAEANVDYIEVGYRNGLVNKSIPVGPTGQSSNVYISDLISVCPKAKLSVMVHPMNVSNKDLYELKKLGVSMIRICLTAPRMEQNLETIRACKYLGFVTTANIIKVSSLKSEEVLEKVNVLDQSEADVIYIADSFGNLIPQRVSEYIGTVKSATSKKIGFHAHNNLSLALANSLAAIECGAEFIDTSICGMGFGIGNLPMEILAGYMERVGEGNRLDVMKILKLASFVSKEVPNGHLPIQALEVFWGLNNLSSHFRKPILAIAERENVSVFEVSQLVANTNGIKPNEADIMRCLFPVGTKSIA